jgi:Transposase, Mutator family
MLEQFKEEIKRRMNVDELFPSGRTTLRLVSAMLIEINKDWEPNRGSLTMEPDLLAFRPQLAQGARLVRIDPTNSPNALHQRTWADEEGPSTFLAP